MSTKIGILGAGALGSHVARLFVRAGATVTIANRRGPASLVGLVEELGPSVRAGSVPEAAQAEMVVLALRWVDLEHVLPTLPAWQGRIVVDATNAVEFLAPDAPSDPNNPLAAFGIRAVDLGSRHSSAVVRELVPGARVIKAFSHVAAEALSDPQVSGGQRVLFYSGDDAAAKQKFRQMLERAGHFPVDLGALDVGGPLASVPFGPLAGVGLVKL